MNSMRLKLVGLVASLLVTLTQAGGSSDDSWASSSCETVYSTEWSVTTQYVPTTTTEWSVTTQYVPTTETDYKTVTTTETDYVTVSTTDTVYITDTTTEISIRPTTITDFVPTTIVSPTTVVQPTTIVSTVTVVSSTTIVETTTVVQPTTVVSTVVQPTTVSRTITSVDLSTITDTVSATVTDTTTYIVSTCPTTSLTGLVTCTSRIVNPTYTPPAPLPSNYLWGCPPGTICTPPEIGCNWEQNPPADSYVCAPSECKPVPSLPTITNYNSLWPNPTESNCAWDNPVLGYFHLNPEHFGLSFAIFNVDGQPVCPASAPPKTVGWVDWIKPNPTSPPKLSRRVTGPNPIAQILRRQSLAVAPAQCYMVFDTASTLAEQVGHNYDELCLPGVPFQSAVSACRSCASANSGTSSTVDTFPELQSYFTWCQKNAPT